MSIVSNNIIALGTGGVLVDVTPPPAPTISLAAGTAQVVATIAGAAGATHYLKYKGSSHTEWQDGGSRSGNGDITVTGLSNDVPYIFIAYSQIDSGPFSSPAVASLVTLSAEASESTDLCQRVSNEADIILAEFGESIIYKPRGGGLRPIIAVVDRGGAEGLGGVPANAPLATILVKNCSADGISSSELDTGGDKVTLAVRIGETARDRNITKPLGQDCGMLKLEVR